MVVSERKLWNTTYQVVLPEQLSERAASECHPHSPRESNKVHWVLDVTLKKMPMYSVRITQQKTLRLRRMALNLLNREQTFNGSLRMKRYRAAMDNNYFAVLAASRSELPLRQKTVKGFDDAKNLTSVKRI